MSDPITERVLLNLDPRELRTLGFVMEGLINSDIALAVDRSRPTINRHMMRIYDVTGMSSRKELMYFIFDHPELREALRRHVNIYEKHVKPYKKRTKNIQNVFETSAIPQET